MTTLNPQNKESKMLTLIPTTFTGALQKKNVAPKGLNIITNHSCGKLSTLKNDCIEFSGSKEPKNLYSNEDIYVNKKEDGPFNNIKTAGFVYLDGGVEVEGDIEAGLYVLMEEGCVVKGNITANGKIIAKTGCVIHGDVESKRNLIQLKDPGTIVKGDVKAKHKIEVFNGAVIEGNAESNGPLHIHGEGSTVKKDAIAATTIPCYGGVVEGNIIHKKEKVKTFADYFKK